MKFEFGVLVFVEESKCREPREKGKLEKTLEHY